MTNVSKKSKIEDLTPRMEKRLGIEYIYKYL
jgi:hypothetical protein